MKNDTQLHTMPQRLIALVYGLICHLSFGAAVLAMALSLFTGLRLGIGRFHGWSSILANGILLATFPLSHSWLLSRKGRRMMARLVPFGIGNKISMTVFVTLSSLQLLAAFVLWSPSGIVWWQAGPGESILIGLLAAGGWLLLGKSMSDAQLDLQLGLVGWWAVFRNRKAVYKPFATRGLYRFVRQPIYVSFAMLLWLSTAWTPDQLVLAISWTLYCIAGAALKERRFTRYFGDAFRTYQHEVPFFIPALGKKCSTERPENLAAPDQHDADVLIAGAGPIGLLLANLLGKRGLRVIIAERRTHAKKASMAIGITPPSLEILKALSLDRLFMEQGVSITKAAVYENKKRLGDVDFSRLPSRHRCILSLPQARTVALLRKNLSNYPSVVLLEGMQFVSRTEHADGVRIRLQHVNTSAHFDFSASYLVGCDGHRSAVRTHVGIPFPGRSYRSQFFMADFIDQTDWGEEARLYFSAHGSVEAFPLPDGQRRWIVQMPPDAEPDPGRLGSTVADRVRERTGIGLSTHRALFASSFRPQRRLAVTYRSGRTLLCGDAAHIMSPIGGQGMNTGFADAAHLDRTIADALERPALAERMFHQYTRKRRHAFRVAARRAARGMWLGTRGGRLLSLLRRLLIGHVFLRPSIRERLAHCFAMLTLPGNKTGLTKEKVTA